MIIRLSASIAVGTAITLGLLFTMQQMIASGRAVVTDPERVRIVDFVRVERTDFVEKREVKPDRPPEPEQKPDQPRPDMASSESTSLSVSVTAPAIEVGARATSGLTGVSDGEYLPIVKVAPVYPTRALARRLEGYVIVEFTVTALGTVKDVAVVESTAPLFEEPAVEAALRFKYKPRVINGAPVEVAGVYNRIVFTMDPSQLAMQR